MSRISKHTHSAFSAFIERRLSLLVLFVVFWSRQSFTKTEGGPPLNMSKDFIKDIIDLYTDSENSCGVHGNLETEISFDYCKYTIYFL
jgi:hypothetical protein